MTRLLDIPGFAEHAIGLKTVTEALYLRDHVRGQLEVANELADPAARQQALTFVVVGAGYAGVELTAQMARLTCHPLALHPNIAAAATTSTPYPPAYADCASRWTGHWPAPTRRRCAGLPAGQAALITHAENAAG